MIKRLTTLLFVLFALTSLNAQTTIANASFENWDNPTSSKAEPVGWNSNKTGGGNASSGPQTCFRESNNPHTGTYCAKVLTGKVAIIGVIVNGSLTTGKIEAPTMSKSDGYIGAYANDPLTTMAFTGRPDSLSFWYRYSAQGSDFPSVEALLHVNDCFVPEAATSHHGNATPNIIARASFLGSAGASVSAWTRVAIPFDYEDGRTPEYIMINTTSSGDQSGGQENSTLWLDDFEAIYNPTLALSGNKNYGTFYVSATNGASIDIPFSATGSYQTGNVFTAQLSNASGSFASPVSLGTLASLVSGTINGTIAAGTAAGTYGVRVVSNSPSLVSDTGTATVVLVNTSIAPSTAQTIATNTNGTQLSVTESAGFVSREWKYTTSSGGAYQPFSTAQTGVNYTPNFTATGTYFVVCETTYPGGTVVRSNEVQIKVVGNSIAPASPQSLLVNASGSQLTVTESATATTREWKYTTTSGSNYQSFSPAQTSTTYVPQFATAGNYYVVCVSTISAVAVTSNEVQISVNSVTLAITSITGFPLEFSPNAPDATVSIDYSIAGGNFSSGNIFTAQLSDATGSFANAINIGNLTSTTNGTISATVSHSTAAGAQYRVRVIGSNPSVFGTDNGVDLVIDQFHNSVSPMAKQTIQYSTNGTDLSVSESQNTTSREWKYGSTNSGPFQAFSPAKTTATYTPNFAQPGTYFVVCTSTNQYNDDVTTDAVEIEVTNGSQLEVTTVNGAPFLISPKANVAGSVEFSSNIIFGAGNQFDVELSDANGSFVTPLIIGSLSGTSVAPVSITIPNSLSGGNGYKARVVSSSPAAEGTPSAAFSIIPFEVSVTPDNVQNAIVNVPATTLTAQETHPAIEREWLVSFIGGSFYNSFSPRETDLTINPVFLGAGTAYVICRSINAVNDTAQSPEIIFLVEEETGIHDAASINMKTWFGNNHLNIVWEGSEVATFKLFNLNGAEIVNATQLNYGANTIATSNLPQGIYVLQIISNGMSKQVKLRKE